MALTGAERQARYRARKRKSINRRARTKYKQDKTEAPRRYARANAPPLPDGIDHRIGDCRVMLANVADNSVPLILTDPPWHDTAEPLYAWLASWSARVLIPGGSLICYTGNTRVNRDIMLFERHLTFVAYRAIVHMLQQRMHGRRLLVGHAPILHYSKGPMRRLPGRSPLVPDTFSITHDELPNAVHSIRDKTLHAWGKGDGGCRVFIEHLTDPGELIVDPFAGSATFGRIAHGLGRRVICCDVAPGGTTTIEAGFNLAAD
jgi:hypothetical protein